VSQPADGARVVESDASRSDAALLAAHADGDPDAFGALVRRHQDRLWAVALRTLGNREEAADAVQDALLSAYRSAGSAAAFRGEAAVTTWLHRIVVNACLDRVRRKAVRPADPLPEQELPTPAPDAFAARDTALDVTAALATLPPEQRAALVLVDMYGWPVDAAAEVLDCPVGTVKSRCARGRARLAPLLSPVPASPDPGRNHEAPGGVPPEARQHRQDTPASDSRGGGTTR